MLLEILSNYGGIVPDGTISGAIELIRDVTLIVVPWLILMKMHEKK
ncbi:MAG: hypothetical protein NT157_03840 [Candidatus Micrarchaeota archaeon]|nr:hypothetical protein [Candidatus Micrarchaeota archaeon]